MSTRPAEVQPPVTAEPASGRPGGKLRPAPIGLTVILLTVAFTLSYVDRNLLSLLVIPIKASLGLSDTQIGVVQGVSFSIFYVLAAMPLAWLADRGDRPKMIAVCVAAWSGMTALCGLTASFAQLLLVRIGVAVGEAGLPPAALTLMADQLDRARLARATSIFMLAPFIGGGLVLIMGGPLYDNLTRWTLPPLPGRGRLEPWQTLFVVVGLPGFLLALLIAAMLREPAAPRALAARPSLRPIVRLYVSRWRLFARYTLAISLVVTLMNAHIAWLPTALIRAYGIDVRTMGLTFGPVYLVAGAAGTIAAGLVVARAAGRDMLPRTLRFMRLCAVGLIVPAIAAPLAPGLAINLVLLAITVFLTSAIVSMATIPLQIAAPHALRAQAMAATTLAASLLGTGLGPLLVGVLSDALSGRRQPLSSALALIAAATVPTVALLLSLVIRHVDEIADAPDREELAKPPDGPPPREG